jgi:hypothetical protein
MQNLFHGYASACPAFPPRIRDRDGAYSEVHLSVIRFHGGLRLFLAGIHPSCEGRQMFQVRHVYP